MSEDTDLQRRLRLAEQLDAEHGWRLTPQRRLQYAQEIGAYCANIAASDAQLAAMLRYYHQDHTLVDALRESKHPEHSDRWVEWTRHAMRLLAIKTAGYSGMDQAVASLEDLAQDAIQDLWRGLPTFSYQSSFQTWAFTVIGHCLARHYRALQTQKRSALPPAQSLDALLDATGDTFRDRALPSPEDVALGDLLSTLVQNILDRHPDHRLRLIFQLWASEEQTLRAIGDRLNLSVARVHVLLKQAIALLRDEMALQDWIKHEMPEILVL